MAEAAMAETGLRFGILGPLQITAEGADIPAGTPKQRAVLAMLVINRNRAIGADSLMGAAWGDDPPEGARATIHSYMSNLRRLIAAAGEDAHAVLASVPPGYRLAITESQCDHGRFNAAMHAGVRAAAAGQFEEASSRLAAALGEWRGPVLEDLRDFDFVEPFAQAVLEDKLVADIARAEAEIACGRASTVIGELESLTAEHLYREPLWAQLITAYYLVDRQSDALDAYHRLKTTLADDLGIDPSPTVRALYERVLRQETLDVRKAAVAAAESTMIAMQRDVDAGSGDLAALRDPDGNLYPLAAATRIGRSEDNDIVLSGAKVSRHHAVINDTGAGFTITDLGSANGVEVLGQRIRANTVLNDGDGLRIGDHQFTFEYSRGAAAQ
jgi:SARP family transcriptional regulator, regulator of embCAB operon